MKIPASIRRLYDDQKEINDRLKSVIDKRVTGFMNARWHYESRVKEVVSFALKIESGRFMKPDALEDFFAGTIVVTNAAELAKAEGLVRTTFNITERRPRTVDVTRKHSDSFPFDDLRLYVKLGQNPALPPTDLAEVIFELQLKTFLQHAWSIATHDLLYKTDDVNWSKERIAYQIKAMLEHAEVSIQEAEALALSTILAMEDARTTSIKKMIALLKSQWSGDELPEDVRHLAQNIAALMDALRLEIERLAEILNNGKAARGGTHPSNLSPFGTIVQYLLSDEKARMVSVLTSPRVKTRILIPSEVEFPPDLDRATLSNAVFIAASSA
jgi:hypothetical protein